MVVTETDKVRKLKHQMMALTNEKIIHKADGSLTKERNENEPVFQNIRRTICKDGHQTPLSKH